MKDSIKNRKNKLLALCLSAMMLSSVAAVAACGGSSDTDSSTTSSSSSTSQEKDTGLIKNAGFETYNENNAINTSPTGWSKSTTTGGVTALTSKAASGIIDLHPDAVQNLIGTNEKYDVTELSESKAEKVWDELTIKDKLAYYEAWKADNSDGTISKDLSFYESFNIDEGDLPAIENLKTHNWKEGSIPENTKVLMIHNQYPEETSTASNRSMGTAQKFTSSSTVTVKAGTSVEFSVWVKTQDLWSTSTTGVPQPAVDKGAYISVTHSVGGKSLDEYMVKNINTEYMNAADLSNGWKQYTFLFKGSSYVDSTFSIVLGLGQGGGTYRGEYVNGYAFFDDIQCNEITNEEYQNKFKAFKEEKTHAVDFSAKGDDKVVNVAKDAMKDSFALNFFGDLSKVENADLLTGVTATPTTSKTGKDEYSSVAGNNPAPWLDGGFNKDKKDVYEVFDNVSALATAASGSNTYLTKIYNNYFTNNEFMTENGKILLLMSTDGAAYTANLAKDIEFGKAKYLAISFYVKTSDMEGYTGAGITLVDGDNKTSFSALDTSALVDDEDDLYDGWQKCFFFVENAIDEETLAVDETASFSLSFNFGPTAIDEGTAKDSYHHGFAAFTGFEVFTMTEDEYAVAQSGTYAKLVSVKGDTKETTTTEEGFDNPKGVPSTALDKGLAQLQNYKGVYSDSAYITGSGSMEYNTNKNAGMLSKEAFTAEDSYFYGNSDAAWLNGLQALGNDATAVWNKVFGSDATRPVLIWNADNNPYGYIGGFTSIAANTYTAISLRVKVSAGATANIYLIDTTDDNFDNTLSIGGNLVYWYDKDGNVCTGNPNDKATQVAFKLQSNGLYKAYKYWSGYSSLSDKEGYYANLSAYTEKDEEGNLLVAEGGASHDYSSHWNNEGLDGIAFYYSAETNSYYADRDKTIVVKDLATVGSLKPRYEATKADKQLMTTVTSTNGGWQDVTFYIHTGDVAKNYRLEIWSGDREGNGNTVGSYIVFDKHNPGDATSNFTSLLEQYGEDSKDKIESVFSYYDTAMHLRYNEDIDEKGDGNLYSYDATASTSGIAYMKQVEGNSTYILADYQYSEKAVTASTPETDDDESADTSSETEADTNPWLLASSLAIAIILVFVVISIIARKVWNKVRKTRAAKASKYNK